MVECVLGHERAGNRVSTVEALSGSVTQFRAVLLLGSLLALFQEIDCDIRSMIWRFSQTLITLQSLLDDFENELFFSNL